MSSAFALEPAAVFFSNRLDLITFNGVEGLLYGTNGFRLGGEAEKGQLGSAVAKAGDVNGDGRPDFLVSAPLLDIGSNFRAGRVYLVWGGNSYLPDQSINLINATAIDGTASDDRAGTAIAGAGDLNGDGLDDVAVGVPFADLSGSNDAGYVAVVFGRTNLPASLSLGALDGTNGFRLTGEQAGAQAGFSVAFAGDVNGDGRSDLLIGSPGAMSTGRAYVVFGATNFPSTLALGTLNGTNGCIVSGENSGDQAGTSIAALGDFNGDGRGDFLVGSPFATNFLAPGRAYAVFGRTNWPAQFSLALLNGTNGITFDGNGFFSGFGQALAGADVNHDGYADAVVGARSLNRVYVFFGSTNPPATRLSLSLNGTNGFVWTSDAAGSFGFSVASAGHVNFDAWDDLIIGAPSEPTVGPVGAGRIYVLMGQASFAATTSVSGVDGTNGFILVGQQSAAELGHAVASAGDLNGDGLDDLLAGEWLQDYGSPAATNAGAVYLVSPLGVASFVLGIPEIAGLVQTGGTQTVAWASQIGANYDVYTSTSPTGPWGWSAAVASGGTTTTWEQAVSGADVQLIRIHAHR